MVFLGINPEKAIQNIMIRKEQLSSNKMTSKRIKSALVVQGGGMRGVFSAGSLIALQESGLGYAFDAIYGSSGGAMNAAYFLSNQTKFGTSIYYEDINNSKFINLFRINKILDMDYLFEEVVTLKKPLNLDEVKNAKASLYFFVTDVEKGISKKLDSKSCDNILKSLKASCALPIYYNKPIFIDGIGYLDGGICKAIPIQDAINDGCTDILVLLTQPTKISINFFEDFLMRKFLSRFGSKLVNTYLTGVDNYNYAFDISLGKIKTKKNINIATIVPDNNFKLNRLTKSEKLLKSAAIEGARKIFNLFNKDYDFNNILKYD